MKNTFYISYADIISQLIYNQLGQLKIKKTGGTQNGSDRWQEVDYKYNIRGWLTDINDVGLVLYGKDAEPPTSGDDLFAFRINYNDLNDGGSQYADPLYNGNIAQTIWKSGDDNVKRGYVYNYDELNRLLEAQFYKSDNNPFTGAYTENLAYDLNGNITSLFRTTGDVYGESVGMDDLAYSYQDGNGNSNLLLNVSDAVSNQNTGGFKDGNTNPALDDYEYDANGNMVKDRNKGITSISYNYLNLPERIEWSANEFITYQYNAAGQKVTKTVRSNDSIKVVRYLDGFQYAGDILQFFPHSEGYVKATPTGNITPGSPPTAYAYNYVFNYTDHLGNIRLSYTKDPQQGTLKILEENHYYPFGLKHEVYVTGSKRDFIENSNDPGETILTNVLKTDYQYKYQGQELQDELGLNWYSFKWRNYDPAIGRFFNHDPLSEKYTYNSPYAFQENKMGMGRELEGLELKEWIKDKAQKVKDKVNTTVEQGKNWIKDNFVAEAEAKVTFGAQAALKTGFGSVEGGLLTGEVAKVGVSTDKGAYAEKGDGKGHNFAGANVKVLDNKLSVGAKVDYVTDDIAPPEGSDLNEYYSNNGELQWGINLGPEGSIGPGIKGDYDFLSTDSSVGVDSDCKCLNFEIGGAAIIGIHVNIKIGLKEDKE